MIMAFPTNGTLENLATKYIKEGVENTEKALEGASFIIAEWISDNAFYRKSIRQNIFNNGFITSKLKKNAEDSKKTYEMYYDFQEKIKYAKHYRVLAMNRGEDEKILTVSLDYNFDNIQEYLEKKQVYVSTKTSCCPIETPSKLVYALTHDKGVSSSSVRISISHLTKEKEIDEFLKIFDIMMKEFEENGKI